MQPQIHLIDETWIDAPGQLVAAAVADPLNWRRWWPTLNLTVTRDRQLKGIQWAARSVRDGDTGPNRGPWARRWPPAELSGTVEIWLEPYRHGVVLHHFLRLDAVAGRSMSGRAAAALTRRFAWHAKRMFWQLKDELEHAAAAAAEPDEERPAR